LGEKSAGQLQNLVRPPQFAAITMRTAGFTVSAENLSMDSSPKSSGVRLLICL
jgi:hypothetical protein